MISALIFSLQTMWLISEAAVIPDIGQDELSAVSIDISDEAPAELLDNPIVQAGIISILSNPDVQKAVLNVITNKEVLEQAGEMIKNTFDIARNIPKKSGRYPKKTILQKRVRI